MIGAAGLAASRWAEASPGLGKVDRRKLLEYPTVSLKERDRRWNNARKFMQDHKVEALLALESDAASYFTNDPPRGSQGILFPLSGDPIAFLYGGSSAEQGVDYLMRSELDGQQSWVRDWRFKRRVEPELVRIIQGKLLSNARIGTIGLFKGGKGSGTEVWDTDPLGAYLKNSLPNVTFVELFDQFVPLWMVHSEEELVMFRKAALGLEAVTEAYIEACKPRATLADVAMAIFGAAIPYGLSIGFPGSLYTGPEGGRGNKWMGRGLPPPVIQKGHVVHTELSCSCGHMGSQIQISVSVGEPSREIAQLGRLSRESYEAGMKILRPGITFGEVATAMAAPIQREKAWNLTPFIHSMNPNEPVSARREGIWENYTGLKERLGEARIEGSAIIRGDIVIQEGMTFAFEPNASLGRMYVNIGGGVYVTKDGCVELNDLPNRLVVVEA